MDVTVCISATGAYLYVGAEYVGQCNFAMLGINTRRLPVTPAPAHIITRMITIWS